MDRLAELTVIKVVDGDTVHGRLDIGWGIELRPRTGVEHGMGTVRVLFPDRSPYDAPEAGTADGRRAIETIRGLVPPGSRLQVISFKLDDFGRTLGAVTLPDGRDWATTMTELGFVKVRTDTAGTTPGTRTGSLSWPDPEPPSSP